MVYEGDGVIEAPNWSRDGHHLLLNQDGILLKLPLAQPSASQPALIPLDLGPDGYVCNNDHDYSPNGKNIAFSATCSTSNVSKVYVCAADGSKLRLCTPHGPSYFHGWSPDSKWLAFVAERGDGNFELYRVAASGGDEERLTFCGGYDDGPEYSPDGRFIYFNSNRSGRWEIWRIPSQGAGHLDEGAQQITHDAPEDWFPHVSPDGEWIVFLSFPSGTEGHDERMAGMSLRLIAQPGDTIETQIPQVLHAFFGGQGSINVNSWSPDSSKFAFVSYAVIEGEAVAVAQL